MQSITIQLPVGYSDTDAFDDAALVAGYSPNITTEEEHQHIANASEMAAAMQKPDAVLAAANVAYDRIVAAEHVGEGNISITYTLSVEKDNPISSEEFGKQIWLKFINERINATRLAAIRVRLETGSLATFI